MKKNPPIVEFDSDRTAILNPAGTQVETNGCQKAVACFFGDVLEKLSATGNLEPAGRLGSEMGHIPVYRTTSNIPVLTYLAGQGAPFSVQLFEKMIAAGIKKFIAVSGCGVLTHNLMPGEIVIIQSAIRDEGTSYHYLPPSREVDASPTAVQAATLVFENHNLPYRLVKSWSTDAIYRETPARREARIADGCLVVEMEAAALYAAAQFRGVDIVQVAYAGDLVIPGEWDKRGWDERIDDRLRLFHLAVEGLSLWDK